MSGADGAVVGGETVGGVAARDAPPLLHLAARLTAGSQGKGRVEAPLIRLCRVSTRLSPRGGDVGAAESMHPSEPLSVAIGDGR